MRLNRGAPDARLDTIRLYTRSTPLPYVDLPAAAVFMLPLLNFELRRGPEKIAELLKAVVPRIEFAGTIVDLLPHAPKVCPARFVRNIVYGITEQLQQFFVDIELFAGFRYRLRLRFRVFIVLLGA